MQETLIVFYTTNTSTKNFPQEPSPNYLNYSPKLKRRLIIIFPLHPSLSSINYFSNIYLPSTLYLPLTGRYLARSSSSDTNNSIYLDPIKCLSFLNAISATSGAENSTKAIPLGLPSPAVAITTSSSPKGVGNPNEGSSKKSRTWLTPALNGNPRSLMMFEVTGPWSRG